jgi:predicted amidohydrolase YtcJ
MLLYAVLLAALAAHAQETVYHNGHVITMDDRARSAQAFLVRDGRFAGVGTNDEILRAARPDATRVDLKGRTVVPGLNDSHTHPIGAAMAEADGEIPVLRSIKDIQTYIRRLAAVKGRGGLIFVPKVYSTRMAECRYPTRYDLDEASGPREAMTDNSYAAVLNSALLRRLNITRDTPQPANGKIIQDAKGEPTGLILGARQIVTSILAARNFTADEQLEGLRKMQAAYNAVGITSTGDRGQTAEGFRVYQELKRRGQMTVRTAVTYRISAAGKPEDVVRQIEAVPFVTGWGDEWLRVGPIKSVVDGGILIGTAYLRGPYGQNTQVYGYSDPDYRGVLNVPRENLIAMAKTANRLGWQMTSHATGGGAIDLLLEAYEEANKDRSIQGRRFTVTHGNFPNADAIAKAKKLGVAFDCQPQWHHFDGPALAPVFGSDRVKWFLPFRSMFDAGLIVAGGSDHMIKFHPRDSINAYHPFYAMWMTITRKTAAGEVLGPDQRITREEALRMWTVHGAWLTFEENEKGTIEAGKLADFTVIDRDYLRIPEDEIRNIEALLTVVGGKRMFQSPAF